VSQDARFEDGAERPLRLKAETPEDVAVISSLLQDAVLTGADLRHDPRRRRFDLLLNRFRWEDADAASRQKRAFERVRTVLGIGDVLKVSHQGLQSRAPDQVLSLLAIDFAPGEDGTGVLTLTLSGDGALQLQVECVDLTLTDVTRPYRAPSGSQPKHPDA